MDDLTQLCPDGIRQPKQSFPHAIIWRFRNPGQTEVSLKYYEKQNRVAIYLLRGRTTETTELSVILSDPQSSDLIKNKLKDLIPAS